MGEERKVPARWQGTPAEPYWRDPQACAGLVEEHGTWRLAAASIGVGCNHFRCWLTTPRGALPVVSEEGFRRWASREKHRRRQGWYDDNPELPEVRKQARLEAEEWLRQNASKS